MDVWPQVDILVERASSVSDLHRHRLHLYAAWRWRSLGRVIPDELHTLERAAVAVRLAMPALLDRVREAYDGPIVLLKGADVAAFYPRPELRPSLDVDLLVHDADEVHRRLLDRGFDLGERSPLDHHHLQGLVWPGLPGAVEIHSAPNWPPWLRAPEADELMMAASNESSVGRGIRALDPSYLTLLLTAHLWRDDPMGRLGSLLDVFLAARASNAVALERLAKRWGLERLWSITQTVAARVLLADRTQDPPRILTHSLESMRERSLIESRFVELTAPFYALKPSRATSAAARNALSRLRPIENEPWPRKIKRTWKILLRSFSRVSVAERVRQGEHGRLVD